MVLEWLVLLLLLVCSALISGAEVAFFGLSSTQLKEAKSEEDSSLALVLKLLQNPKRLLATILVANNTINIGAVLLFDAIGAVIFSNLDYKVLGLIDLRFVVEVGIVTFLILLFGEILPKIYASRNSLSFSKRMARPIYILDILFAPLSRPMQVITGFIHDKFGNKKTNLSIDQLSQALELTSEEDTTAEEQKILQGIVSFGNTDTKQVMRPRIDIFALGTDMPFKDVVTEIIKNGYSRIPIFQDNIDTVAGVLYVKDLLPHIDKKSYAWEKLIRPPYFVPENKKLDDLLKEFQEQKNHLAIVVDEYGGTSGLVTLEDIIEEIVGDITDEFDDEDLVYSKINDNQFVFEGKTALRDFYKVIDLEDDSLFEDQKGEAESIAGFVLEISGSFPKKGDRISFENYMFDIEALDRKRIKQVKVTIP
ncbi:gliding motility-associated protein GldE [Spongiivirga citrea]|uniref:Gliding motility-associated protein GldE n=2 Tax=Spongiivirga citrea TaxID=1481457 RepID=A0A6M0CM92_9FLAO|nr:gliding motility-associated protein GldE [Spongiivirga citrea]NER17134.1 gliding motility-associated protein GldE [Spongiivirga citrea]